MSQEVPMTIASVKSLGQTAPRISTDEIIEISDSEDELEGQCKALSNGHCRRQAGQKRKAAEMAPDTKISNGHDAKRPKTSLPHPESDGHSVNEGNSANSTRAHIAPKGILHENNCRGTQSNQQSKQEVLRRSTNGSAPLTASPTRNVPPSSAHHSGPELLMSMKDEELVNPSGTLAADVAGSSTVNFETVACKTEPEEPVGATQRNQRRFLKPPSPRAALSKKEFHQTPLEDVDDLIAKYGPHLIQNVTIKDIKEKAIGEMKLPKNLKVTPQLNQKRQFKMPISADDEVIVISDDETVAESASLNISADCSPQSESYKLECDFKAKESFLENFQLYHDFKKKRPLKRDIANVLKTRNIMKAYIVNPHVSLLKANCIYKYVTSKGILSSEQFRARKEALRRKKKTADASKSKRVAPKAKNAVPPNPARRVAPDLGIRKSIRRRAMRIANQPQRSTRHFFTSKFKESISKHEGEGVWTSYSIPAVTRILHVPMIVLKRIDPEKWKVTSDEIESATPESHFARPKEYKCRWCLFHCLNIPSLREHCFDYHGKIFPSVIS